MRKTIDAALLQYVREHFTCACHQFGFQRGITVQQVLLQVHANAERGLRPTAVLDLAKAYDKVDGAKLLQVIERWLPPTGLNMMRASLGLMAIRTKNYPRGYVATLTKENHKAPRRSRCTSMFESKT